MHAILYQPAAPPPSSFPAAPGPSSTAPRLQGPGPSPPVDRRCALATTWRLPQAGGVSGPRRSLSPKAQRTQRMIWALDSGFATTGFVRCAERIVGLQKDQARRWSMLECRQSVFDADSPALFNITLCPLQPWWFPLHAPNPSPPHPASGPGSRWPPAFVREAKSLMGPTQEGHPAGQAQPAMRARPWRKRSSWRSYSSSLSPMLPGGCRRRTGWARTGRRSR